VNINKNLTPTERDDLQQEFAKRRYQSLEEQIASIEEALEDTNALVGGACRRRLKARLDHVCSQVDKGRLNPGQLSIDAEGDQS